MENSIRDSGETQRGWLFWTVLVSLQLAVALVTSQFFFNSDTIFFLARQLHGLRDAWGSLFQLDDRGNFRPFTLWISSALLIPLGGLNVWAYRLFAAIFHVVNTVLVYHLARILAVSPAASRLVAFFFGLHWILFNVTYGLVCLPDLCYVLFSLLTLLTFQKFLLSGARTWKALSLLSTLGAFLSKEMAVVVPLLVVALSWMHSGRDLPRTAWHRRLLQSLGRTTLHWGLLALYLVHFALLGGGSVLSTASRHPYAVQLSAQPVFKNAPYFAWLANLPRTHDRSRGPSEVMLEQAENALHQRRTGITQNLFFAEGVYPWIAGACWVPVLLWCVMQTGRRASIRRYLPICLALVSSLIPVLFLVHKLMPHNLYMAVAGMGLWLGLCLRPEPSALRGHRSLEGGVREWALFAYLLATIVGIFTSANRSWLTHGSVMAENAVEDLPHLLPDLAPNASLYFLKSRDGGLPWYYEGGNLFRIILRKPRLSVYFQDRHDPFPPWVRRNSNEYVLRVVGSHLYNATPEFLLPSDRNAQDLAPLFDIKAARVSPAEYYPRYDSFDTPSRGPAFAIPVHRFHLGRNALVLIAGASIEANLPEFHQPSMLALGGCLVLDQGDGVVGRVSIRSEQGEKVLFESEFLPATGQVEGGWLDTHLDLSEYAGRRLRLKLETYNRPGRTTIADWLAWSLVLVPKGVAGVETGTQSPR